MMSPAAKHRSSSRNSACSPVPLPWYGHIAQRTVCERDHALQVRTLKACPSLLAAVLRIERLVPRGVGHQNRRAVDQFDVAAAPRPPCGGTRAHLSRHRAGQFPHQRARQVFPGIAIGSGVRAARLHTSQQPIDDRLVHRVLARSVGAHDPPQEHRQGHGRGYLRSRYLDSRASSSPSRSGPVTRLKSSSNQPAGPLSELVYAHAVAVGRFSVYACCP